MRSLWQAAALGIGGYLALRYLLGLVFPFLLGLVLALAAEPVVRFLTARCRLGRTLAAGVGVSLALGLLSLALVSVCALVIRELGTLTGILPEVEAAVRSGMGTLSEWVMGIALRAPESLRDVMVRSVTELFSGGSAWLDRAVDFLLHLASGLLTRVPGGALWIGTAVISAYMISGKLPAIRGWCRRRIPKEKLQGISDGLGSAKATALGWLKAQLKLSGVTYLVVAAGFLVLRVPYGFLWAVAVALVDAFPILGTGAVLVPWSLVSFLRGDHVRAFALLGIYGAATLIRTVLEPRLVGRHLGLDPLVTLFALYAGYKIAGLPGMLLAPMAAVTVANTVPRGTAEP